MMKVLFYLLLIFLMSLITGWVRIVCDGNEILKDVYSVRQSIRDQMKRDETHKSNSIYIQRDNEFDKGNRFYIKHIIREGESLYALQEYYGVSWEVIKRINAIDDVRRIQPGSMVLIPIVSLTYSD